MTCVYVLSAVAAALLILLPGPVWLALREVKVPRHGRSRR